MFKCVNPVQCFKLYVCLALDQGSYLASRIGQKSKSKHPEWRTVGSSTYVQQSYVAQ